MADNKAVVERMFDEIINQGRLELIDELFDPEFQSVTSQGTLDRDAFKDYVRMWRTGFPDVHCEVGDFVVEGDKVAWSVRATGTHTGDFPGIPATGRSVDFESLNIGEFRDGRAYRHKLVQDMVTMLVQLGVMPPPGGAAA